MRNRELSDLTSRGKERPWKKHKLLNKKVIEILRILEDFDKAYKVAGCGSFLEFGVCPDGHGKWLKGAHFCKDRVCSMCIWRKSLFMFAQFLLVAHKLLELYPKTIFLFQTLTLRNCVPEDLSNTLTHLNKSFRRYLSYKRVKAAFKGVFRTLETTYNPLSDTFHPHIHSIVAVNKHYFASRDYITHEELQQLWRKALQVDYDPDCDIRRVKPKKKNVSTVAEEIQLMDKALMEDALAAGGAEVAKYSTKVGDIVNPKIKPDDSLEMVRAKIALRENPQKQAEILDYLMKGISGRRFISYTGIFREAYQALKCKDVEDSDLINIPGEEPVCRCRICQSRLVQMHYLWNGEGYFEIPREDRETSTYLNVSRKRTKAV
jgi:plasmid rolling circle replication initiator protein Rep